LPNVEQQITRNILFLVSLTQSLEQISTAVAKFREIKENLSEGIKFYVSLQVRTKLLSLLNCPILTLRSYTNPKLF
jgi:hypothetical protein